MFGAPKSPPKPRRCVIGCLRGGTRIRRRDWLREGSGGPFERKPGRARTCPECQTLVKGCSPNPVGQAVEEVQHPAIQVDASRPVTCALSYPKYEEHAGSSLDVILVNRYFSWYSDTGHLELIYNQTVNEFTEWHLLHNKPVMISEYGAGTIAGFHMDPAFTWTEEYQAELMVENFKAFDTLRSKGFFFGEMIWNFADFATNMGKWVLKVFFNSQ
ncbi:hypothetical protein C7M84_005359 [Penaeus vannamei]|uniref:Glycoside hydrolase family 2 catalytic domain-containing protein n=1 Tax=Penaeus vannamei TaxID=6689 RepID=A0A3R7QEC1_PENVA|nr:hypothetical protein C7M84_005359 [Penaeus vannamei]